MEIIYLVITGGHYNYEYAVIDKYEVISIQNTLRRKRKGITWDCYFVHYFMKELKVSEIYRNFFIQNMQDILENKNCLELKLKLTTKDLIDYNWNDRVYVMVREKCELDHALSWLSTLGGAFSALGDYFVKCAETAGKISVNQFKVAIRLGDPQIAARCRLYFALSLIQTKKFKIAKKIIYKEYKDALKAIVVDVRLLRMCKGIWAKLQYEHFLHIEQNKKCTIK